MCYQVCIAFPFSSRFSKTKLNLQHHGESRCGQLEAHQKRSSKKKSCPVPLWGICVNLRVVLVFDFSKKLEAPLELLEVEPWVDNDKNYATNHHFFWKVFFGGENVTPAAGCTFLVSIFWGMIFQRRHLQGPGFPIAIVRPKGWEGLRG